MLVGVIVQTVEQGHAAFGRQHRLAAGQRRQGAQQFVVTRAKQIGQLEAEQRLAPPLAALDQQPFFVVHQQHPARRVVVGEQTTAQRLFPVAVGLTAFVVAVDCQWFELQGAELFVVHTCNGGGNDQQRLVLSIAVCGQHRQFTVCQGKHFRSQLIADGLQQRLYKVDKQAGTFARLAFAQEALTSTEVAVGTGGGSQACDRAFGALLFPLVEQRLEVFFEDLVQVVLAVELVGIGQAGNGKTHGYSFLTPSGRRRR
ncbi:hypothetical protein D9M69_511340 [compost metagenome]